jgi:hypothetical protein
MIAKVFHSAKDFPFIRGKSFVITGFAAAPTGRSGHIRHATYTMYGIYAFIAAA